VEGFTFLVTILDAIRTPHLIKGNLGNKKIPRRRSKKSKKKKRISLRGKRGRVRKERAYCITVKTQK